MDVLSAHRRPAGCGIMGVGWRVEFVGMHTLSWEFKCPKVYNEAIVNPRNPSNIKNPPFLRRALSQPRPERRPPLPCLTKNNRRCSASAAGFLVERAAQVKPGGPRRPRRTELLGKGGSRVEGLSGAGEEILAEYA